MMMAKPIKLACPNCKTVHRYSRITSINDIWSEHVSDGYISGFDIGATKVCSNCDYLIKDCNALENLGLVDGTQVYEDSSRGQKFWRYEPECVVDTDLQLPELKWPKLKDWIAAYKSDFVSTELKLSYATSAMHEFNQLANKGDELDNQQLKLIELYRDDILEIENILIDRAQETNKPVDKLLAADIYRRRGDFESAAGILDSIDCLDITAKVSYMRKWIMAGSTKLEVFPSYYNK
ncbi:hypothetical protein DS2_19116 [Catenovulum agarivorans DS-2]|uniref:Uncharacterized protein n=1 Tax=Catenovulum agarivorans DS-2 TaxID=1328313 RepID=W7QIZ4_9ALTE|nr:hypothetical protein [Catenovulum agarivorans]EWH08098.1 hypothetical protein DS2_19116 [Catenovulum agarivorans DS-2]